MKFIKNNRSALKLLLGLVVGGIMGIIFGERTALVAPVGQLFLNFLFMILVPLVFFSVASAIANMDSGRRLGKIMGFTLLIFSLTAFVSAVLAFVGLIFFPLMDVAQFDVAQLIDQLGEQSTQTELSISQRIVSMLSVEDFYELLSKNNMLAVIIASVTVGFATNKTSHTNPMFKEFLNAGNQVMMQVVEYIMYLAPIGLGCYFAASIGQLGTQLIGGYTRTLIIYCLLTLIYFFGVMSIYAFLANKKQGVKDFWRQISTPALTAIATCSSAACIPVNIEYTKKMNVDKDIAETVIPLGANIHKDGSVMGGVFKIAFLFILYGKDIFAWENILLIIFGGVFVGLVMGSIPGGGAIAETMIVLFFGFPAEAVPLIMIISTLIDIPATLLNSAGNTVSAMLVQRLVQASENKKSRAEEAVRAPIN